jgi:phosphomevalonate kinase
LKARAPGKLVLSGAYSVLEGAPAIVSAVDRYVECDSERPAALVTAEVRAALGARTAPHFDAEALREGHEKLGLGSSAAILVASLAALSAAEFADETALRRGIEAPALRAHREAQGGGSGVDVATSIWGGTLVLRRTGTEQLELRPVELPPDLCVEAWTSGVAASTPELLGRVRAYRARSASGYEAIFAALRAAAERAVQAVEQQQTRDLILALDAQRLGFAELGRAAGAGIITDSVSRLAAWAAADGAAVLPSGAGGGDIVLWVSTRPSPAQFRALAAQLEHHLVPLGLNARGVHIVPREVEI